MNFVMGCADNEQAQVRGGRAASWNKTESKDGTYHLAKSSFGCCWMRLDEVHPAAGCGWADTAAIWTCEWSSTWTLWSVIWQRHCASARHWRRRTRFLFWRRQWLLTWQGSSSSLWFYSGYEKRSMAAQVGNRLIVPRLVINMYSAPVIGAGREIKGLSVVINLLKSRPANPGLPSQEVEFKAKRSSHRVK